MLTDLVDLMITDPINTDAYRSYKYQHLPIL